MKLHFTSQINQHNRNRHTPTLDLDTTWRINKQEGKNLSLKDHNHAATRERKCRRWRRGEILRLIHTHLSNSIWPLPVRTVALGDGFQHPVLLQGGCTDSATLREEVISFSLINKRKDSEKGNQIPVPRTISTVSLPPLPSVPACLPACWIAALLCAGTRHVSELL